MCTNFLLCFVVSAMYSYIVPFAGKMASGRGKSKDVMVTDEQLAQVEYELARNRMVEENEERMARLGIPRASVAFKDACEASRPPKQKKRTV
jgi:hypothetical protein